MVFCLILLMFSFAEVLNCNWAQLINSFFMNCVFGVVSKKVPNPKLSRFSPMLSYKNLIVLYLTFGSVIYFALILVKGIRSLSRFFFFLFFFFLRVDDQLFQHHLLKRLSLLHCITFAIGFPGGSVVKNPPVNAGDEGSIPGSGRFPGEGSENPLQYSCLGNFMERGAGQAIQFMGVTKNWTRLSKKRTITTSPLLLG